MSALSLAAIFLVAAAVFAPLAKRIGISSILGYLVAGVLAGPSGLGLIYSDHAVEEILHLAEFGVVLLLFLIGLELRPQRLWTMRMDVAGAGGGQVLITMLLIAGVCLSFDLGVVESAVIGGALALSSTAFAIQLLEEKGQLRKRHGRVAFAVLLFQDMAAIPMIAIVPLLAVSEGAMDQLSFLAVAKVLGTVAVILFFGRYVLRYVYRYVASTGVREGMTAASLLTVVVVALLMEAAGLSAALGAFLAGILIGGSEYRHEIEANIAPFERILLGVFFTAVGMGLNVGLLTDQPIQILSIVFALMAGKAVILYGIGRQRGLPHGGALILAGSLAQGGEFAFVLFSVAGQTGALAPELTDTLIVAVTLSMALTPLLYFAAARLSGQSAQAQRPPDTMPEQEGHVIIAGFGRFGQIPGRMLTAKKIQFTAVDKSSEHVDFVKRFGNQIYYGDASRPDLLDAAEADKARALVLAIDNVDESIRTASHARSAYPDLPIFARARNRQHAYDLMDLGVQVIHRETFHSALALTEDLLVTLGESRKDARRALQLFKEHDEKRLVEDYKVRGNLSELQKSARRYSQELEDIFEGDWREDEAEKR